MIFNGKFTIIFCLKSKCGTVRPFVETIEKRTPIIVINRRKSPCARTADNPLISLIDKIDVLLERVEEISV